MWRSRGIWSWTERGSARTEFGKVDLRPLGPTAARTDARVPAAAVAVRVHEIFLAKFEADAASAGVTSRDDLALSSDRTFPNAVDFDRDRKVVERPFRIGGEGIGPRGDGQDRERALDDVNRTAEEYGRGIRPRHDLGLRAVRALVQGTFPLLALGAINLAVLDSPAGGRWYPVVVLLTTVGNLPLALCVARRVGLDSPPLVWFFIGVSLLLVTGSVYAVRRARH